MCIPRQIKTSNIV